MAICVSYAPAPHFQRQDSLLGYREVKGFDASDLADMILDTLAEYNTEDAEPLIKKLVAWTADGASTNGVRRVLGSGGKNVANLLFAAAGRKIVVTHCSPHRLQLSVSAAFHYDAFLKEVESNIKRLFNHLRFSPGQPMPNN